MDSEGEESQGLQLWRSALHLIFSKMCLFLGSLLDSVNSEADRAGVVSSMLWIEQLRLRES